MLPSGRTTWFFSLLAVAVAALLFSAAPGWGQGVGYTARFYLEEESYLRGEPIFCVFEIRNEGPRIFQFPYRVPSRAANPALESEPKFSVAAENGEPLADVGAGRCRLAEGSVVYGLVRLSPGQIHRERWLLNEWVDMQKEGTYRVRAERRLPLRGFDEAREEFSEQPSAYARALNEMTLEILTPEGAELEQAFRPYRRALADGDDARRPEAVLALTTSPQPFLLEDLTGLAQRSKDGAREERLRALDGLARLGTPPAWKAIVHVAQNSTDEVTQSRAVQLLAEKGDTGFLGLLLEILPDASDRVRSELLQGLGSFEERRAAEVLFERLHGERPVDRVGALLGLRNMGRKETIPSMIAMLYDPSPRVRQVANFALRELTGRKITLPARPSPEDSQDAAQEWRAWWRENNAQFTPRPPAECRSY